jgi:hypothetical protein
MGKMYTSVGHDIAHGVIYDQKIRIFAGKILLNDIHNLNEAFALNVQNNKVR